MHNSLLGIETVLNPGAEFVLDAKVTINKNPYQGLKQGFIMPSGKGENLLLQLTRIPIRD